MWRPRISGMMAMRTDELDFDLPPELIAQVPPKERGASRLLHFRRHTGELVHQHFSNLPGLLRPGDLLVFNDTRVLPARFFLRKTSGGRIEGLFLKQEKQGVWQVMLRAMEGYRGELSFEADGGLSAVCLQDLGGGIYEIEVNTQQPAAQVLERLGRMPLPPYIKREKGGDWRDGIDRQRYQTVYARNSGSVAAPTAGLHFTPELLAELDANRIQRTCVTLHVGAGTFKPVTAATLAEHVMHTEEYEISEAAAEALNKAAMDGRRIVAVGTTSARVLESHQGEKWQAIRAETSLLIYPPYQWKHVGALLTNFHLPRSTLIALVAAFTGLESQRRIYAEAIAQRYRFFSYGDAMLVE
jgi:S-adenosylmethionine:tRNA ribosyltransferase-isomerase